MVGAGGSRSCSTHKVLCGGWSHSSSTYVVLAMVPQLDGAVLTRRRDVEPVTAVRARRHHRPTARRRPRLHHVLVLLALLVDVPQPQRAAARGRRQAWVTGSS